MFKSSKDRWENYLRNNLKMQDLKIAVTNGFALGLSISDANVTLQTCSLILAIIYTIISIKKKIKDNGKN